MKWHPIPSYIPTILIFGLATYQFWKRKGFIYKMILNIAKKENPEVNENDFQKKWLRAIVAITVSSLAVQVAIAYFR